ncbi:hypothetical protein PC9H_004592 [Pleurotus ostreatus]|uniref:Uncharacterized protein n=2 Tax=Pleurotus ostreatus TaxID=5322 RepID=A0A067N5W8_PLEO1|nr:uncharacterized protein PC9H_004592 [Pleurotus ostreatus]KAF7432650.1 hypothetical protein PC9H_004592 [Pleurotus ostreatus]KAJ8698833.1 hypothetical protein PTI98_005500 [Pleurotus ostreatus]KDQ22330.1 hypothetical protein PLEOSDRAFT_163224 [Pleurotus ostreatus PC15]
MSEPDNTLYDAQQPLVSTVWRLYFLDQRESSPHDLFALLHYIDVHVAIHVFTVVRTWDGSTPVYWIKFRSVTEALVARGFATNAEDGLSVQVAGALVRESLFQLAEEAERNSRYKAPREPNRWDNPLKIYATPFNSPNDDFTTPAPSYTAAPKHPNSHRSLYDRLQRTSLAERLSSA